MRTWFLLLTLLAACNQGAAGPTHTVSELDAAGQRLIGEINTLRVNAGLEAVEADTGRCDVAGRHLQRCVDELSESFFQDSVWREELDRIVEEWEKWCVLARAESVSGLLASLLEAPGLAEAALDPGATHAVAAAGSGPGGSAWCVLCVSHRVISFGPGSATFTAMGHSSLTLTGVSRSRYLLIESSVEGEEEAIHQSVAFEADEAGAFRVTLSLRRLGPQQYRLVVSVRDSPEDEYRPAAQLHYPGLRPCKGRPRIVPKEAD